MSNPFGGAKGKKPAAEPFATGGDAPARKGGDPFSTASTGSTSDVRIGDLVGELLLIRPTEYIESMVTTASNEPTDAIRADVVVLNADGTAALHEDLLVFPVLLKRDLKRALDNDEPFLGRLSMGEKKPGKSAPYIFVTNPQEEEKELARAYGTANNWW